VAGSCEYGNEHSGSIKYWKWIDLLIAYEYFYNEFAS
jgi:hypothetical protein